MINKKHMIFTPIIIPTLNGYEHFRKCLECLESLEACTGAEKTMFMAKINERPRKK